MAAVQRIGRSGRKPDVPESGSMHRLLKEARHPCDGGRSEKIGPMRNLFNGLLGWIKRHANAITPLPNTAVHQSSFIGTASVW
jgi:hypothetical protein